ncbi:TPA: hypothetical protein N0F65_004180 [Lagenidium giganteum]|uniref:CCHC-type domain-containing protein n=1 Tax=Lagenidium giganteum TaxID=4803 RepID=A0AAV2YN91_9STRA|nr:TPA: hypothetical protein N0F65_004180 [Lagenidium giganteum]
MISFDTFTAAGAVSPSSEGSESGNVPLIVEGDAVFERRRSSSSQHATSQEEDEEESDGERELDEDAAAEAAFDLFHVSSPESKPQQWLRLLTMQHQAGDARVALVNQLMRMANVNELLLSKATEEQIASAADEAITDEILASVDREDRRRQSITSAQHFYDATAMDHGAHYSPYRVLELVDLLDSTTGGMVKRILTKVRRRTPFSHAVGGDADATVEFCRFCAAFVDHSSQQHRCRICRESGTHRSRNCNRRGVYTPESTSSAPTSGGAKHLCSFCDAWVFHASEHHRCRICGELGTHSSKNCAKRTAGEGYRWRGSPVDTLHDRKFCVLCDAWRFHTTEEHRCRQCQALGDHRSKNCALNSGKSVDANSANQNQRAPAAPPASASPPNSNKVLEYCNFCAKHVTHRSDEHICHLCRATGAHRSLDCPHRKANGAQAVLSYSVSTASRVRDRVLETIPMVLPATATTLVFNSMDKVGDVDTILRKTLQRLGVWSGGSQTPIATPYAAPVSASRQCVASTTSANATAVYVLAYAEGHSVVPERILKYMRLLMHHDVSTNAFSVVVRYDSRSSQWELQRPGMVTPQSLPSSPTLSAQLQRRMAKYTLQVLLGAREKLISQVAAQRQCQQQRQFVLNDDDDDEQSDQQDQQFQAEETQKNAAKQDESEVVDERTAP